MTLNADAKLLAVGAEEGVILIYELPGLKRIKEIKTMHGAIWALTFDSQNNLFSANGDKSITRWDLTTSTQTLVIESKALVNSIDYWNEKKMLIIGGVDGVSFVEIKDKEIKQLPTSYLRRFPEWSSSVSMLRLNSSETNLVVGNENGTITLWDIEFSEKYILNGHSAMISDLRFNAAGSLLVSTSYDGSAMVWNLESINNQQIVLNDHSGWVLQACFDPDGQQLITGDGLGIMRNFNLNMDKYSNKLCDQVKRNLREDEWGNFVGFDIPYTKTCPNK
jgi:WD domain, G-beta repeat